MENQRTKLDLKGIQRFQDGINTNPEGSCDEIINLRKKDGQWTLMYKKEELYDLSSVTHIDDMILWYNHPVSADGLFICYDTAASANQIKEIDSATSIGSILLTLSSGEVASKIYHFGNYLIVATDLNVYYIKYDLDTNTYILLPDLGHGLYAISSDKYMTSGSATPFRIAGVTLDYGTSDPNWSGVMSDLRNVMNGFEELGYGNGHTLFRFGFKMVDGSIIMPTTPYYHPLGMQNYSGAIGDVDDDYNETPHVQDDTALQLLQARWGYFVKPSATLLFTTEQIASIQLYEGLINKLAIFMTRPLKDRDEMATEKTDLTYIDNPSGNSRYVFKNADLTNFIKNTTSFYEVHEIDIMELTTSTEFIIDPGNLNIIETSSSLEIDNFTAHKIFSDILYEYNSRLHIGNTRVKISDGYNMSLKDNLDVSPITLYDEQLELLTSLSDPVYVGDGNSAPDEWDIFSITTLYINNETKYVLKNHNDIAIYKDGATGTDRYMFLNAFVSYPDDRATNIKYVVYTGGQYKLLHSIDLTKHDFLNISYGDVNSYTWNNIHALNTGIGLRVYQYISIELVTVGAVISFTENNIYNDTNRVQASKINNPIFYPAENSYRIGRVTNEIIGIMSQATPMSEGQYGYYPLMIFTSEGIFSLEQGAGEILYKSIQPVTLDVCNNIDSVIAINGGIMFVSEKGLMVLYGRKVDEISKILEGEPKDDIKTDSDFISAVDGSGDVADLGSAISTVSFLDYLADAKIAYDINNDEIIISNDSLKFVEYSYVYSTIERVWYKIDTAFSHFIVNHPNWLGLSGNKIYDLSSENTFGNVLPDFLVKTNPFRFSTNSLKTIERLVVRFSGFFSTSSGKNIALYVYGSLNNKSWKLITGLKVDHTSSNIDNNFLMLRKIRTSAKYFIVFLACTTPYSFMLDEIEFDVKPKITKKLR